MTLEVRTTPNGMSKKKVIVMVGTRPEAIKMAPVITALRERSQLFDVTVVSTGQHRELLDQAFHAFGFSPDRDLDLMEPDQSITGFAAKAMGAMDRVYSEIRPDLVLVQGDTTTVFVASVAARYHNVAVGHVEAGLRSFDDERPFPEEINRRGTTAMATWHFAPTPRSRANLLREGVARDRIHVTGNTVVDALQALDINGSFDDPALRGLPLGNHRMMLVTAHRRESHGEGLAEIFRAVLELSDAHEDLITVFPVHPNPNVRRAVDQILGNHPRIFPVPPVGYTDMIRLMRRSFIILSDSGGVQEEAPSMNRPLLILRDVTERPEVLEVGAARLVGTSRVQIVREADRLLSDPQVYRQMASLENPFGDGHAAERIVEIILGRKVDQPGSRSSRRNPAATFRPSLNFFSRATVGTG